MESILSLMTTDVNAGDLSDIHSKTADRRTNVNTMTTNEHNATKPNFNNNNVKNIKSNTTTNETTVKYRPTTTNGLTKSSKELRDITIEELQQHNTPDSTWVTIDDKVYDVTKWINYHPGGQSAITNVAGRDVSDLMRRMHRPEHWQPKIKHWLVGRLVAPPIDENSPSARITKDFRELGQWLENNGWFVCDLTYYVKKLLVLVLMWMASWVLFYDGISNGQTSSPKWTFYLSAAVIGMFWQQANFVGHDVGHSSIFVTGKYNFLFGNLVGNIFTGLGNAWWKHSHETHHVTTNVISHDPDIQQLPVLAITKKMIQNIPGKGVGFWSSYWNSFFRFDRLGQLFVSYQHILFLPITTVARINLHAMAIIYTVFHRRSKGFNQLFELSTLGIFWLWWGYMLYLCPTMVSRLLFWYISHAFVGIVHVQIVISHFLMETPEEVRYHKNNSESFYEYQLRTTLDIDCPWYMDWFHGGIQFQVGHHLFPRLPRHRLRHLRPKIEAIIAKYDHVKHVHYTFPECVKLTLRHLKTVAMHARSGQFVKFKDTVIFETLNMIG